jgi:hypothetical protein
MENIKNNTRITVAITDRTNNNTSQHTFDVAIRPNNPQSKGHAEMRMTLSNDFAKEFLHHTNFDLMEINFEVLSD